MKRLTLFASLLLLAAAFSTPAFGYNLVALPLAVFYFAVAIVPWIGILFF